jgi:hypothetical protein
MAKINAAVSSANIRFMKLGRAVTKLKESIEETGSKETVELAKHQYPNWKEMTRDEFEGKVWYIREMLLPILDKDSKEVFEDIYAEEEAKILGSEEVIEKYSW